MQEQFLFYWSVLCQGHALISRSLEAQRDSLNVTH